MSQSGTPGKVPVRSLSKVASGLLPRGVSGGGGLRPQQSPGVGAVSPGLQGDRRDKPWWTRGHRRSPSIIPAKLWSRVSTWGCIFKRMPLLVAPGDALPPLTVTSLRSTRHPPSKMLSNQSPTSGCLLQWMAGGQMFQYLGWNLGVAKTLPRKALRASLTNRVESRRLNILCWNAALWSIDPRVLTTDTMPTKHFLITFLSKALFAPQTFL